MADVKILLVEDESIEAMDIKRTLESFGYEVPYVASSSSEAVEKTLETIPDLILMDIILKGEIDGIETVSKIKNLNIPVIYLTAHSEESTIERAKLTEPYGYIIKPYNRTELKYDIELAIYKNKMEKKLKDNQEKFLKAFNENLAAMAIADENGQYINVNKSFQKLTGYNKRELIGHTSSELNLINPKIRDSILNEAQNDPVFDKEVELQTKSGEKRIVLNRINSFKQGEQDRFISFIEDINARKKAEEILIKDKDKLLDESEEEFQRLFNTMVHGVVYHDANGKITSANPAAEKILGLNINQMQGRTSTDPRWKSIHEDGSDFPGDTHPAMVALKTGQKVKNVIMGVYDPKKKETRWIKVNAIPEFKENKNRPYQVYATFEDITHEKQAEKALIISEKRYRELFSSMIDMFQVIELIYDKNGKAVDYYFRDVNHAFCRFVGKTRDQLVDKSIKDIFGIVEDFWLEFYERVAKTGKPDQIENYGAELNKYYDVHAWKVKNNEIAIIFTDITRHKQAEAELSNYRKELENLVKARTAELEETHKALKESEENFRAIAENSIDSILIAVENGKHVYVNPKAAELTGYSEEELLNTYIEDIAHPDEIVNLKKRYDLRMAEKPIPSTYETRIVRKDNEIVPIEISAAKTIWKDQPAVMVQISDITNRKKIEEKLKLASLYNRSLIEASLDPLVTIGPDGKVNDVNKATETVTGYSRDEIIGSNFSDYFTEPEKAKEGYKKVFHEGLVKNYPLEIQHRNGHKTPVLYNATIYKNESEEVVGVFAAARDISQLIDAEKDIQMLANVVKSTDDAIITKSLDGTILSWNKGAIQIYGYSPEEVLGKNISILAPDNLKQETTNLIENIKQGQKLQHYETIRLKKNGELINVSITLSPVFDSSGKMIAISTIARDITEEKKSEEMLKKSVKDKEVLLREIHHRVKNNLQIVASLLNLQECSDNQNANEVLNESMGRIKTMATIHEKLYESPSLSEINFKEFTEKLVYDILYSYRIPKNNIKTNLIIEDINLNIDTAMPLGLIINELVTNTVKYAFPKLKGTITIKLKSLPEHMELTIADDGIGLPKELNMENISTLGLELVKNLVDQLEGNLILNRKNGTEFKITFKEVKYKERL